MDLWSSLLVTGGSTCSFRLVNRLVGYLPTPEPARNKSWRWRNISTSLVHSALTGAWAVSCFCLHPEMAMDLISTHSLFSHSLVAVSTGYFIHDFIDLAFNQSLKKSWEVMLHHAMVTSCFGLALTSRLYVGFAVVSLLVEINSVFLHVRQLLLLAGQRNRPLTCTTTTTSSRPSTAYRLISLLNLATFLMFRVCTLGWMTRWLAAHGEHLPRFVLTLGTVGLGLITTMSTVLFYRLLRADVF